LNRRPLNSQRDFKTWPHFNPGRYIDFNPSFVRTDGETAWVVFHRDPFPPEPGNGSIWAVRVDGDLEPRGAPFPLIGKGADPRVISLGRRVLLFYVMIERDGDNVINGSSVAIADFSVEGDHWNCTQVFQMPKHPVQDALPAEAKQNWEKNWVPFVLDDSRVALIYSHEPWDVLVLDIAENQTPKFENVYRSAGIRWDHGTIRGGTPPVRYDDDHLVTFFHSSQVMGSRKIYSVGACVFLAKPPYAPVLATTSPLIMAPYNSGVHRFGWRFAASVVFPAGVEHRSDGFRLTCGRDDGEIATFDVGLDELKDRLEPCRQGLSGTIHDYRGGLGARLPLKSLLYVPDPIPGIPELPMINFVKTLAGGGRTFVDVGAHIGFYTMALAPGYQRVISFEPSRYQYGWLKRNVALNDYQHVQCEHVALGDLRGQAKLTVLSHEGGLNTLAPEVAGTRPALGEYFVPVETLDDRGLEDVDLLKIDVEGFEIPVLRGATRTIQTSRPVILIEVWDNVQRRQQVGALMQELGYSFQFLFPSSPELTLCLPRERQADFAWFV